MRDRIRAAATLAAPPDPTADEALARARTAMTREPRALMALIGRTLCATSPTLAMREVTRLAYPGRVATDAHGFGTPHAVAVVGLLLRHMPRVDGPQAAPITRAEYGMRLIRKADA
ncbi:hypothetical protein ACFV2A_01465 [Streptomyces californicus]|uniref:hypothetical protein n=1 Tax=Streptomyces californicus TaxID=67351 RepID=UPI003675A55A